MNRTLPVSLIVDDDLSEAKSLRTHLGHHGMHAMIASSVRESSGLLGVMSYPVIQRVFDLNAGTACR